jgi:(p)ppGpp synthase/HD superfamily hydrolase
MMENVQKAIELAVKLHAGQFRKEHNTAGYRIPFIVHPMQVMKLVFDWGCGTPTNLVAAICHDVLEDTGITPEALKTAIGDEAYRIVDELTFHEQGVDPRDKQAQKAAYLKTFTHKSVNALVIKAADRYCNVHDFINSGDLSYAAKYSTKAKSLYDAVFARHTELAEAYGVPAVDKIHLSVQKLRTIAGI